PLLDLVLIGGVAVAQELVDAAEERFALLVVAAAFPTARFFGTGTLARHARPLRSPARPAPLGARPRVRRFYHRGATALPVGGMPEAPTSRLVAGRTPRKLCLIGRSRSRGRRRLSRSAARGGVDWTR